MSILSISDVYASIHKRIREDSVIRNLMGFTDDTSPVEEAIRIQKRIKPVELVESNLPLISFYSSPGYRDTNHLAYITSFDFDIYTSNDVETAFAIADRINVLFDDKYLSICRGSFKANFVTSAEDTSDMVDVFKYFTKIEFTFSIESN